ncbi:MAG: hypothetical protein EA420_11720 [Candidatus Competibacteraceae bacterium]|nr:MAG: hypothetical protein EA420_11720 [Candidatus Competibacteraceae bacterium]
MTDVSKTQLLHPSLQRLNAVHQRRLRLLGLLFFLAMAGTLVFLMITAFTSRELANLIVLAVAGLVMLPMVALMGGLMWYLDRRLTRGLGEADRVLRQSTPASARLQPVGRATRFGVLMAVQHLKGGQSALEPLHALINPSFRWSRPPDREVTVELYCQDLQPGSPLVALQSDGGALLGKIVAREAHERDMRRTMIAVVGLLALAATVVLWMR